MTWQKYNGESIKTSIWDAVETNILKEIDLGNKLKVYIGTDSQIKRGTIDFATVIVFLREHRGGFMFVHKDKRNY